MDVVEPKEYIFPETFKLQAERKLEEHKLVATDEAIEKAIGYVDERTPPKANYWRISSDTSHVIVSLCSGNLSSLECVWDELSGHSPQKILDVGLAYVSLESRVAIESDKYRNMSLQ